MGFVDYATTVVRQNKKLKNSARDKYFKTLNYIKKSNLRLNKDKVFHNTNIDLDAANLSRKQQIFYNEIGLFGASIVLTILFFYAIGSI